MSAGLRSRAPLVAVAAAGALVASVLWVWPFASIREAHTEDVVTAEGIAESLDGRLAASREAEATANDADSTEHRRFSDSLDEHLMSVLDSEALAAWSEEPGTDAPLAFLNAAEARWRAETQVASALLADYAVGVAEVSVSDPQPVEGLDGLEMSGVSFRAAVGSLEDVIALVLALDSRPDVILDEVRTGADDGPQGTGLWWAELAIRWYRLPDTLEPQ